MSSDRNPYEHKEWSAFTPYQRATLLRSAKRNDSCPCGSGKKFKKCHVPKYVPRLQPPDARADSIEEIAS